MEQDEGNAFSDEQSLQQLIQQPDQDKFVNLAKFGFRFNSTAETNGLCISQSFSKILITDGIINWHPDSVELIPITSRGDGNCLLHSCSLFMWGINDIGYTLRGKLYKTLAAGDGLARRLRGYYDEYERRRSHADVVSPAYLENMWTEFLSIWPPSNHKYISEYLEEFHIFATAHVLRRPIICYGHTTSKEGRFIEGVFLPLLLSSEQCSKSPVLISFMPNHFNPLMRRDRLDVGSNASDTAPSWNTVSVGGGTSNLTPLFKRNGTNIEVKYIFHNEEVRQKLEEYLNIFVDGERMFAMLNDDQLPPQFRLPRPQIAQKSRSISTEPGNRHETNSSCTGQPTQANLRPDKKMIPYLAYIEMCLTNTEWNAINACQFRFLRDNERAKQSIDEISLKLLISKSAINWRRCTCRLLPVKCAGSAQNMTHAISLFLWGIHDHKNTIRRKLAETLMKTSDLQRNLRQCFEAFCANTNIPEEKWNISWLHAAKVWSKTNIFCINKHLGKFHLFALAHTLRRPIIVYSAKSHSGLQGIYLPRFLEPQSCVKTPVLLAETVSGLLLPLMRADVAIMSSESNGGTSNNLLTEACDENGETMPDQYSEVVPLITKEKVLLPVRFPESTASPSENVEKYLYVELLDDDWCAKLYDSTDIPVGGIHWPEDPRHFEESDLQHKPS